MGICGGFEMMGKFLYDPHHVESPFTTLSGFGFFDFMTTLKPNKKVAQVAYQPTPENPFELAGEVTGYEIHCGEIDYGSNVKPLFTSNDGIDGAVSDSTLVFGTFIHDIFKNPLFTRTLINHLRIKKKLPPLTSPLISPQEGFEKQINRLAKVLKESCSLELFKN
jgi:adenosylcobyric acid synthase